MELNKQFNLFPFTHTNDRIYTTFGIYNSDNTLVWTGYSRDPYKSLKNILPLISDAVDDDAYVVYYDTFLTEEEAIERIGSLHA